MALKELSQFRLLSKLADLKQIMKSKILNLLAILVLFGLMFGCKSEPYRLRGTTEKVIIDITRVDEVLFGTDPSSLREKLPLLKTEYSPFMKYFSIVIGAGDLTSPDWEPTIISFATDKMMTEAYKETSVAFPSVEGLANHLGQSFGIYKRYYPEAFIPEVYTCLTGFNNSIIIADSVLGISLDMYLGQKCEFYPPLGLYSYQIERMTPENIVYDCFYAIGSTEYSFGDINYDSDNVLSNMLHEGKLVYFARCMTPDTPLEVIFGFTRDQWAFLDENEGAMWDYLVEKEILFSSNRMDIRKLTGEAPFTGFFSQSSPGRSGVWIGYRIVESFMARNPEVTLHELMVMNDNQKLLGGARYRPGR